MLSIYSTFTSKTNLCFLIYLAYFSLTSCKSQPQAELFYLAQQRPTHIPEKFAPGIISTETEYEFGSVFSNDGTEFFYGVDVGGRSEIRYTRLKDGTWTKPEVIISHETYGFNDPFLSPDEDRLYFISDMPAVEGDPRKDHDILYAVREAQGWSKPINPGPNINTDGNEYYISFNKEGDMYFASNKAAEEGRANDFDIYVAPWKDKAFQPTTRLSDSINTKWYEADVFIDPEESYIIFCARRPEGLGRGDLYISFKNPDGTWKKAVNMGDPINTDGHELCPFVTHDGKYFLYTSKKDIYWVDTKIFDRYK